MGEVVDCLLYVKMRVSMAKLRPMELVTQHNGGIGCTRTGIVNDYLSYGKLMVFTSKALSDTA